MDQVLSEGLKPSKPDYKHWLGEGVYFFLDPNGMKWAQKWPLNKYDSRSGSKDGILKTALDLEHALDLSDNEIRVAVESLVNHAKLKLRLVERKENPILDGSVFAAIFRYGMLKDVAEFLPKAIVANFDDTYKGTRIQDSRVFMEGGTEMAILEATAQIQACIIDQSIIGKLTVVENTNK